MIGWVLVPQRKRSTAERMVLGARARARARPRANKSLSAKRERSRRTLCLGLVAVPALYFRSTDCLRYCLDTWSPGNGNSWRPNRGYGRFIKLRPPWTQPRSIHHIVPSLRCFALRWGKWWRTWVIIDPRSEWFSFAISSVVTWNKIRRAHWRRDGKAANATLLAEASK